MAIDSVLVVCGRRYEGEGEDHSPGQDVTVEMARWKEVESWSQVRVSLWSSVQVRSLCAIDFEHQA
jgi:hypothetical protein